MSEKEHMLSREEVAKIEVGRTDVSRPVAAALAALFLFVICAPPLVQAVHDFRARRAEPRAPMARAMPETSGGLVRRALRANSALLRRMHEFEDALENESLVGRAIRPPMQYFMARALGAGNEKAYCGARPWLFYRAGIDYLTGPGFLDPARLAARAASGTEWRAAPQPDPRKAIVQFRDQLARRGVRLVVMPTPVKPMIHPEKLASAYSDHAAALQNPSYETFVRDLGVACVPVFDVAAELAARRAGDGAQYLATDTHWTPDAMQFVARRLAEYVRESVELPTAAEPEFATRAASVSGTGDLVTMLQLPPGRRGFPEETVELRQVLSAQGGVWRAEPAADILVLGDSFCNIYSLDAMGWGESAGLVEQLSVELRRPLDRIVINDNGAFGARAALARELRRGRDRLAGKELVIWQFAARELSEGDWRLEELELGAPPATRFVAPPAGSAWGVKGVVASVSPVPLPGSVPYKDHVLAAHLVDVESAGSGVSNAQALIYMMSMTDNRWTRAARLRPGEIVDLKLQSWSDVADRYEGINRSELDDIELQIQEPCWAEFAE